jgi:alkanesulfonate monooxygenase SsuD/methylene tetrahydromethanopterin reductase-like flavin-dependent oxidoreductase (luciferase family)
LDVGLFYTGYNLENEHYKTVLDRCTEQARIAEEAGFHSLWIGEHHFGGEGLEIMPNPVLLHTWIAAQTQRIRLGLAAVIVTEWHPLRLAEDVAMLDHLSGGRVECGVGRGITSRELSNLNPLNPDRRAGEERNWEIFLESVEILKKAWTEEAFVFHGKHYDYPRPGVQDSYSHFMPRNPVWRSETGEYIGMSIVPKPYQQPHPPLWNVVDKTPGFKIAAEQGLKPITWLRSPQALVESFETYREAASRVQGRELRLGEQCGLMRTCFVAERMDEARRIAEPAVEMLYRDYLGGLRGRDIYAEPGETLSDAELAKPWFDFLDDRDHLLVGTPEYVAEKIAKQHELAGFDLLLAFIWLPGLDYSDVLRSTELFAEEVMPLLQREKIVARA